MVLIVESLNDNLEGFFVLGTHVKLSLFVFVLRGFLGEDGRLGPGDGRSELIHKGLHVFLLWILFPSLHEVVQFFSVFLSHVKSFKVLFLELLTGLGEVKEFLEEFFRVWIIGALQQVPFPSVEGVVELPVDVHDLGNVAELTLRGSSGSSDLKVGELKIVSFNGDVVRLFMLLTLMIFRGLD